MRQAGSELKPNIFTSLSELGKDKASSSENLHTFPLGHGDHENILFSSFGHRGGELFTNKWVKLRESRIRGPPEEISNPSESNKFSECGNFGVQITNPSLDF